MMFPSNLQAQRLAMLALQRKPIPSYAPVYAALYPQLALLARGHGYAMAIHGSMSRDMDVICVPWDKHAAAPGDVLKDMTTQFDIRLIGDVTVKEHGRLAYTLSVGHGECAVDISFMPRSDLAA